MSFGADVDAIVAAAADLDCELPEADPAYRSGVQRLLDERAADLRRTEEAQVREIITALLPTGRCSMERVALRLGLQTRTLHRHLRSKGLVFSDLQNEVRRELAMRYVAGSGRPMKQISDLLGFSEASAFSRWFTREFSAKASEVRAQRREAN